MSVEEDASSPEIDFEVLTATGIVGLSDEAALDHIALLIDASYDLKRPDGTTRAFSLLDELEGRANVPAARVPATIHYFRANAWNNRLHEAGEQQSWDWEQPQRQNEILELRRAVRHPGFADVLPFRQWQIRTNLGTHLSAVGRIIEAIELWDGVIADEPRFAKALGNRGQGLMAYARNLEDDGHRTVFFEQAHASFERALATGAIHETDIEAVSAIYRTERDYIASTVDVDSVRADLDLNGFSLGSSDAERAYRAWCLEQMLFINPLNDLGRYSIAATDVMMLPSITEGTASAYPPAIIGFFNQLKQEYASARYSLYQGLNSTGPHFSDKDVQLYNTLDYPSHGRGTEQLRTAFRVAYSVLDKVAYFLNAYMQLGHAPHRVSFRSVWYEPKGKEPRPLLQRLQAHENWALRGLFWLSKDFYEDEFKAVTEPDAEALADIRNHLEHKYLQLHEMGDGPQEDGADGLRYSLGRREFEEKTLRLFRYARASLIYLSLAVHREEALRRDGKAETFVLPVPLTLWDDEWKA